MNEALCMAEDIEVRAWSSLLRAAPRLERSRQGLEVVGRGGAVALLSRGVDSLLPNRVFCTGVRAPATRELAWELIELYRERRIERFFFHVSEAQDYDRLRAWLAELGLCRYRRSWAKFVRGREAPPRARTGHRIAAVGSARASELGALLAAGFDMEPPAGSLFAGVVGKPGWHALMAFSDEVPSAAALLFAKDAVGYLAGAATAQEFRCQGAQGAR